MSVITTNQPGPGFSLGAGGFDFERSGTNAIAHALTPLRLGADDVRVAPFRPPGWPSLHDGLANQSGMPGTNAGAGGILAALMNTFSALIAQLTSLVHAGMQPPAPQPGTGQTAFAHATASSVGDPHESFEGTTSDGTSRASHWDSMTSHANLLSSDSFDGGYRVSTVVTSAGPGGETQNARANVATDAGQTNVGMNADGSYDVTSFGRHVDLVTGQAVRLDANQTVILNADRSLTIDERNAAGASISTTLRSNGSGGVDVSSTASNVDLGGYLVTKTDGDTDPVALAAGNGNGGEFEAGIRPIYGGFVPEGFGRWPHPPAHLAVQPYDIVDV
ncbi:MAG: hypothetical protein NVSMB19_13930 [Vulcanimicrobiaceae bacterium]